MKQRPPSRTAHQAKQRELSETQKAILQKIARGIDPDKHRSNFNDIASLQSLFYMGLVCFPESERYELTRRGQTEYQKIAGE